MKKLILLELALLFLATTFQSDNPPGWYQQTLPVNNIINDIFFLDSLKGWVVTTTPGYVLKTSDGGNKWEINFTSNIYINVIQLIDEYNGYFAGGDGHSKIFKTTNGGKNWFNISTISAALPILDLSFVNKDTGWICSDDLFDGGVFKTIDGGNSWLRLTGVGDFRKLFFLNKDTGWVYGHTTTQQRLYRTINGGSNWELQFVSAFDIISIFFLNGKNGWIRGGPDFNGNGISYTTDGGFTWFNGIGEIGGYDIKFVDDSIGFAGGGSEPLRILKSTNGGKLWGYQTALVTPDIAVSTLNGNVKLAWAGNQILNHTTDGGGSIVDIQNNYYVIEKDFLLEQNYPNPFNPFTNIKYEINKRGFVLLKVFDISGKEIRVIVNQEQSEGKYSVEFNASTVAGGLSSGVYFYRLEVTYEINGRTYSDTKKMILIR